MGRTVWDELDALRETIQDPSPLALQEFQQTLEVISATFQQDRDGGPETEKRTRELQGAHRAINDIKALQRHFKESMDRLQGAVPRKLLASRSLHTPSEWNDLLQAMAAEYSLQVFTGDSNGTFTICGAVFVIDIEFPNHSPQSQKEAKVKLTLASNKDPIKTLKSDDYLTRLIRHGAVKDFKHVLGYLASLDQIHSLVNLFKYQQAIERDLVSMYEKELSAAGGNIQSVIRFGHGRVSTYEEFYGPCIEYLPSVKATISLQKSTLQSLSELPADKHQYLVPEDVVSSGLDVVKEQGFGDQSFTFLKPVPFAKPCHVSYSLHLATPLLVTISVANQLAKCIHNPKMMVHTGHSNLLVELGLQDFKRDSATMDSVYIYRIPFCHPCQLYPVIKVVRRQTIFNRLLASCVKTDFTGPILQVLQVIPVQSMSVMFFHSRSPNQFQLQIHFSELSEVTYRIVEHQTGGVVSWSVDDRTANHLLVDFSIPSFVSILGSIPYNP